MLDVHAPHEPINTWKGFALHIATIAIGLLIALGLEQTVVSFHPGYLTHTADITSTAVQEQQQTLSCIMTMQSRESVFGDQLSVIGNLKGYGPPLGWWQMIPYFHMAEQQDFAKEHPETNAPTLRDQQQAIAVLPSSKGSDISSDGDLHRDRKQ